MKTLYERLLEICSDHGIESPRPRDISNICGISSGRPKQIKDAGEAARLGADTLSKLVAKGYSPQWVQDGKGEKRLSPSSDTAESVHLAYSIAGKAGTDDRPDEIEIRQFDTGGAMGSGVLLRDQPGVIQSWRVSPEWLQKNVRHHSGAQNLCIVTGFGDSMRGMFEPGDPLLVDSGVRTVEFDAIYFFRVESEGFIKRLQRIPGEGIRAISENKAYESWTIRPGMDFEVFGRVLKAWKSEDY